MNIADLHRRACELFAQHVQAVRPDQWVAPTPCADWNVRDLVNHVTSEDLWTPPLMAGATIAEVGSKFDGDVVGDEPAAAYIRAADEAVAAVSAKGALERTVHLSFGDVAGSEYAMQLFADHLIHAWDLARAIGADEGLDTELVQACAEWFTANEDGYRSSGAIGPRPPVPDDADPQTALLAAFGRSGSRAPAS